MRRIILIIAATIFISGRGQVLAQDQESFSKKDIVTTLADLLLKNYVFADKGEEMSKLLLLSLYNGEYDSILDSKEFAAALQVTVKTVVEDGHLRIISDKDRAQAVRDRKPAGLPTLPENSGFKTVDILNGNIGYLNLISFLNIAIAKEDAVRAMDKLIKTDALIIDLRENGGGAPSMVAFIANYLLANETVHLNTFYFRPTDQTTELWTNPEDASIHNTEIPVYILTSKRTGSAAEGFAYHLKHLKRATIVGETTAGAAHPGGFASLGGDFVAFIPSGRPTSPVTNDNWEGKGVIPHVMVKKEEALDKALEIIRNTLDKK